VSDIVERLQAYSADPKLRPDYAAAMIEAADILVYAKAKIETLQTAREVNREDARRFVFMCIGLFGNEEVLDKLEKAGNAAGVQQPHDIDDLRQVLDATQIEYEKG
jgi:hypothetical protein